MGLIKLTDRERIVDVEYFMCYDYKLERGSGYTFPCNEDGSIRTLTKEGAASLVYCQAHPELYDEPRIRRYENRYWRAATGRCACNRTVHLHGDVQCECGRWYNMSGQELRPPREWGEETGERFDDSGHYIGGGDDGW